MTAVKRDDRLIPLKVSRVPLRVRDQGTLITELPQSERVLADQFMERLPEKDRVNVSCLLDSVNRTAVKYLSSQEVDRITILRDAQRKLRIPVPFFTAYIVGGMITKEGERPDIDIMLATNMRYLSVREFDLWCPRPNSAPVLSDGIRDNQTVDPALIEERLLSPLIASVRSKFKPTLYGTLPCSYLTGDIKGKLLVRFTPLQAQAGRQIDFIYRLMLHSFSSISARVQPTRTRRLNADLR